MSDERRSTATEKESELETIRCKKSSDQTRQEQEEYSGKTARHSTRKRRPFLHRLSDEDITSSGGTREKKRNLDLDTASVFQSLIIQPKETTFETEKLQQHDLKRNQVETFPSNTRKLRTTSPELVQSQEQTTCSTRDKAETPESSISAEITTKPSKPAGSLVQSVSKYDKLFTRDQDGDTILHLAIVHKNIDLAFAVIMVMVERKEETDSLGIDIPNKLRQTALHLAVITCQPRIVLYLVQRGADVNAADRNGQTPLHLACKNADVENIRALRERKRIRQTTPEKSIDVNLKNFEGLAPIHVATLTGSCEVIDLLLEMGADIDLKDSKSGRTALHHAVEAHNPIVTRFLLLKDANVNAQTFSGNTPLHTASGRRMENIVHILLEFGANRRLTNFEGDLPIPETYMPYSMIRKITQRSKESKKK